MNDGLTIYPAKTEQDLDTVRELFREYQDWLGVDLCFQGFEDELASLPGKYAPPHGGVYLVRDDEAEEIAACVAYRPAENGRAEMKRLYVRDKWRGYGLGRELANLCLSEAKGSGYSHMCLDTLGHLDAAIQLYASMGFREIEAYYENPLDGVRYMEIDLAK